MTCVEPDGQVKPNWGVLGRERVESRRWEGWVGVILLMAPEIRRENQLSLVNIYHFSQGFKNIRVIVCFFLNHQQYVVFGCWVGDVEGFCWVSWT